MRVLLELFRILFIFALAGFFFGAILSALYSKMGIEQEKYGWLGSIAILLLLFVLYRNKLQFNGWYKGSERVKLPKVVSQILIFSSIGLLLLPPVLHYFF